MSSGSMSNQSRKLFFSLRFKLLIGFSLIFTIVFALAFGWFYVFSDQRAKGRLQEELKGFAEGSAENLDVVQLLELYEIGERNEAGYSDDVLYTLQQEWFKLNRDVAPYVYPYSFLITDESNPRAEGELPTCDGPYRIIYLVDSIWLDEENLDRALYFLDPDCPSEASLTAFQEERTVFRDLYTDDWGSWISAYTPLIDRRTGEVIGVLGADIEADYVISIRQAIQNQVLVAFGITYLTLFTLVYATATVLTNPLKRLSETAERIGEGEYNKANLVSLINSPVQDEIGTLSAVFSTMVDKVQNREEALKEEIKELKIEIDEEKRKKQVEEITESDFFQDLKQKAISMRQNMQAQMDSDSSTDSGDSDSLDDPFGDFGDLGSSSAS